MADVATASDDGDWHWMDGNGVVHGSKLYSSPKERGAVYSMGVVGCDTENISICDYAQVVDPITCIACLVQRAEFGGKEDWFA